MVTTSPGETASATSRTIPSDALPPTTEAGDKVKVEIGGGVKVKMAGNANPLIFTVTVTEVVTATPFVVIGKDTAVTPFAKVTEAGTVTSELLEVREAVTAELGDEFNRTIPSELLPPITEAGSIVRLNETGLIVIEAVFATPSAEAVIVAVSADVTEYVGTETAWDSTPAANVKVAGTAATVLLELNETTMPPAGAARTRLTASLATAPALTVLDSALIEASGHAGFTIRVAVFVAPPPTAEIVTVVEVLTDEVETLSCRVLTPGEKSKGV